MEEKIVTQESAKPKKKVRKPFSRNLLFISSGVLGILLVSTIFTLIIIWNIDNINSWLGIKTTDDSSTTTAANITVSQEEYDTITVVQNSQPSVVSIAVSETTISQSGIVSTDSNIGTGFVIDANGWIVTNQHVVSDTSADYKVVTYDGQEYDVTEIARDDVYDIAILKIDATGLPVLTLGDSDALAVGQDVIAIGTPLGEYSGSVTKGIISGLHRTVTASSDWYSSTSKTYEDVIQIDAAINPGNSGGPLLNSQGEVIGINFATTSNADNISFALPINKVKERIEEYRTYGKFIKAYFGVSYEMISQYEALYYSNVVAGAYVVRVDSGSPAAKGGIKKGDIITKFGEEAVTNSLSLLIQKHSVGEEVKVEVYRDGATKELTVTLIEADD